jgi:hypothetical protein
MIPAICAHFCGRYFCEWGRSSAPAPASGAIIPSRTDDLRLARYLRNVSRTGWNFCLSRQHGSATTICTKTCLHTTEISFQVVKRPIYSSAVVFSDSIYIQTSTDLMPPASFPTSEPHCLTTNTSTYRSQTARISDGCAV